MALYDQNGKITIDENAAQYDINKLYDTISHLENSKHTLNNLIQQATETKGETGTAIMEKASELKNQVEDMLNKIKETIGFINRTVTHYKEVDRQVKATIEAFGSGGATASR